MLDKSDWQLTVRHAAGQLVALQLVSTCPEYVRRCSDNSDRFDYYGCNNNIM